MDGWILTNSIHKNSKMADETAAGQKPKVYPRKYLHKVCIIIAAFKASSIHPRGSTVLLLVSLSLCLQFGSSPKLPADTDGVVISETGDFTWSRS